MVLDGKEAHEGVYLPEVLDVELVLILRISPGSHHRNAHRCTGVDMMVVSCALLSMDMEHVRRVLYVVHRGIVVDMDHHIVPEDLLGSVDEE